MNMRSDHDYLFSSGHLHDALHAQIEQATAKVNAIPEQQFVSTGDQEIYDHVFGEMEIEPLVLYKDRMEMDQQEIQIDVTGRFDYAPSFDGRAVTTPGIMLTISIPFSGDPALWKLRPSASRFGGTPVNARVRSQNHDGVGSLDLSFERVSGTSPEALRRDIDSVVEEIEFSLGHQRSDIEANQLQLTQRIRVAISCRREKLTKHASIVQALNIPMRRRDGAPSFAPIQVKRKLVRPLPPAANVPPQPGIRDEDYEHILNVIRHEGRSFEATPGTFAVHDEEALRDIVLAHLNGHYEGDATGEAFRKAGKTDIRIEQGNRAAFVGECKVWRGAAEAPKAVDQMLSYLTWRDCKTALVLFNKSVGGFAAIQAKLPEVLRAHPRYVGDSGTTQPGEWRLTFRAADDDGRRVVVHVFLFNLYLGK
jgi:hypothetical protein